MFGLIQLWKYARAECTNEEGLARTVQNPGLGENIDDINTTTH